MSSLKLYLLGPPQVELDNSVVDIRRRKALALLAYLAVAGEDQRRDTLATLLWPEASQSRARASLSRDLSSLNKRLAAPWLTADRETVALCDDLQLWVDCVQFQQRLASCQSHNHPLEEICPACLEALTEAVKLYRADFLSGFTLSGCPAFDEWQSFQTESLRRELATALERLVRAHQAQGDAATALPYARRWLSLDPLHEPAHRQLMALYAQTGDRGAVTRQYQECVDVLEAELGVSPADETTALYERVRTEVVRPVESISPVPRHNLPPQPTPFIGRVEELARIARRLADPACRLLTLTGPGGIGKTRLALQAASDLVETSSDSPQFAHGLFFVSLAAVSSTDSLVATMAEALNFSFYSDVPPRQQLLDYLREKELLLILDNFEYLLSLPQGGMKGGASSAAESNAATELVTDILTEAPALKIVATSRETLNLQEEWLFPVGGLPFPTEDEFREVIPLTDYSAVQLFEQCARRANPDFSSATTEACVVRICQLVEGMPLGIELAAAWLKMFPCENIIQELERGLDFLSTSLRNVPDRHRSMRAVFEHSWQLLSEAEKRVFRQLSVFRGGFRQEAAEQVAGADLGDLVALVEKSLLRLTPAGRYHLHELLRQFAAEKLQTVPQEKEAAQQRHGDYYLALVRQRAERLKGEQQLTALAEIGQEIENVRAAWNWAVEQRDVVRLEQALEGLGLFLDWQGRNQEGETVFRQAAKKLAATTSGEGLRVLVKLLTWQSVFSRHLGQTEVAGQLLRKSLALLDGPRLFDQDTRLERAAVLLEMGRLIRETDREGARQWYEQSLALYRTLDRPWETANVLVALCEVVHMVGDYRAAKPLVEESLAIYRRLGDRRGIASSLERLSWHILFWEWGDGTDVQMAQENLALRREIGDRLGIAWGLFNVGLTLYYGGRIDEASSALAEGLAKFTELGFRRGIVQSSLMLAEAKRDLGQYEQARLDNQRSLALAREVNNRPEIAQSLEGLGSVALAVGAYAEAKRWLQESVDILEEMQAAHALGVISWNVFGWSHAGLAYVERQLDNPHQARRHLVEVVRDVTREKKGLAFREALPIIALFLADRGEAERAVELYALAAAVNANVANSRWFEDIAGRHIKAIADTLTPEVVAAAQARGKARDLFQTANELFEELSEPDWAVPRQEFSPKP